MRFFTTLLLLAAMMVGFAHAAGVAAANTTGRRPNIILIMADDMGYECVGANGGTSYQTPHLDKLAAAGLRFTHCYSQPLCTPSRVKIMTGIYNQRNYIRFGLLDPDAHTFGHMMKKAGYATCIVGKWQLAGGFDAPGKFGFDEYCLWQLTRRANRYANPGLEINGKEHDYKQGEYGPGIVSDYACDFIARQKESDKPFFLYYPMILPHWPFEPTPDSDDWDPAFRRDDKAEKNYGMRKHKHFADMVAYTDKLVGKVIAKLEATGLRENTIVMFTCDNGTFTGITSMMGDRAVQGGKGKTTDAGTRVPLIVSWPAGMKRAGVARPASAKGVDGRATTNATPFAEPQGVPPGRVIDDLIDFSDFFPTLAELAGATVPAELKLDGRSFAPQLRGGAGQPRTYIHIWYARNGGPKGEQFVRDKRYKLYADGKFYDIEKDAPEQSPLDVKKLTGAAAAAHEVLAPVMDRYRNTRVLK